MASYTITFGNKVVPESRKADQTLQGSDLSESFEDMVKKQQLFYASNSPKESYSSASLDNVLESPIKIEKLFYYDQSGNVLDEAHKDQASYILSSGNPYADVPAADQEIVSGNDS